MIFPSLRPIETTYNGYRFRSRLEARWAVFFDTLGVRYEYEKEGYDLGEAGWYLPDFWLPSHETWIEVKGQPADDDFLKIRALLKASKKRAFLVVGNIDAHRWYDVNSDVEPPTLERPILNINHQECLRRMFGGLMDGYADWGIDMQCPLCISVEDDFPGYVHFDDATIHKSDASPAWEGRGNALRIPMWCENGGHTWIMRLGFHKGCTYAAIESATESTDDAGRWLANWDEEKYLAAIAAARGARFEHGEHGAQERTRRR